MCSVCRKLNINYHAIHTPENCPYTRACYCSYCSKNGHTTTQCPYGTCTQTTASCHTPLNQSVTYPPVLEVLDDKKNIDAYLLAYGETNAGNHEKSKQKLIELFKNRDLLVNLFGSPVVQLRFLDPQTGIESLHKVDGKKKTNKKTKPAPFD
jgi:hypothetical protein